MRGRTYTVGFNNISVSAAQDLFGVYAGSVKAFEIEFVKLGQVTQTVLGGLRLRLRYLPATVTSGSGGNAATPKPTNPNDTAATITARINDTTQATTSGTAVDLPDAWDLPFGYLWMPPEGSRIIIPPSGAFIVSLDQAPGAAITANGHMAVRELF